MKISGLRCQCIAPTADGLTTAFGMTKAKYDMNAKDAALCLSEYRKADDTIRLIYSPLQGRKG